MDHRRSITNGNGGKSGKSWISIARFLVPTRSIGHRLPRSSSFISPICLSSWARPWNFGGASGRYPPPLHATHLHHPLPNCVGLVGTIRNHAVHILHAQVGRDKSTVASTWYASAWETGFSACGPSDPRAKRKASF